MPHQKACIPHCHKILRNKIHLTQKLQCANFTATLMKNILLALALLTTADVAISQNLNLRINEIVTKNSTIAMDDFFEFDDWIEIYNPPGSAITNLAGYYLSDNPDSLTKWQIPADDAGITTVLPNNFIILWIDNDYDNLTSQGPAHNAGFTLNSDGEMILLTAPDGTTIIDSTSFPEMATDISWGRSCDGCAQWQYFNNVTFEDNNFETQANELLFVNEVQPLNTSTYRDLQGEYDPWIEIYNPNNHQVNLANYRISIDGQTAWQIPNTRPARTVLPAQSFMLIWCDNDITDDVNHSPLSLPASGGTIQITSPDGTVITDTYNYPSVTENSSWGRATDGASNSIEFDTPTPTVTNQLVVIQPENLVINELLCANQTGITDNMGELEDWIEIYNPNSYPVDLSGYYFSDDAEVRNKWVIPSTFPDSVTVAANGWILFWADSDQQQGVRHADFRLSNNGEYLSIASPDGYTLADEIQWNYIAPDTSFGRLTDGSNDWVLFVVSTPETSNNQGTISVLEYNSTPLSAYPNPTDEIIYFNSPICATVHDACGQQISAINNQRYFEMNTLKSGMYVIRTSDAQTLRIIKR